MPNADEAPCQRKRGSKGEQWAAVRIAAARSLVVGGSMIAQLRKAKDRRPVVLSKQSGFATPCTNPTLERKKSAPALERARSLRPAPTLTAHRPSAPLP